MKRKDAIVDRNSDNTYYGWQSLYDLDYTNAGMTGGYLISLENKNLKWEKNANLNIGLEAKLFNGRLSLGVDYFEKKTSDLLLNRPKATSTGFNGYLDNIGNMENKGWDITVAGDIFRNNKFTWNMAIMGSTYKNKITKLSVDAYGNDVDQILVTSTRILKVGESINSFYLVKTAGVDPETGVMTYWTKDSEGNRVVTTDYNTAAANGREICGSRIPDFTGSWSNSFYYKGFDLSVLCTFSIGGKVFDSTYANLMGQRNYGQALHKDILDRWTSAGDVTDVPVLLLGNNDQPHSDRFLTDASYFSLKNVTLGYTVAQKALKKIGIDQLRIFATGDNLYLLSARKGMDPQYNFTGTQKYVYSPSRNITFGVDLKF